MAGWLLTTLAAHSESVKMSHAVRKISPVFWLIIRDLWKRASEPSKHLLDGGLTFTHRCRYVSVFVPQLTARQICLLPNISVICQRSGRWHKRTASPSPSLLQLYQRLQHHRAASVRVGRATLGMESHSALRPTVVVFLMLIVFIGRNIRQVNSFNCDITPASETKKTKINKTPVPTTF